MSEQNVQRPVQGIARQGDISEDGQSGRDTSDHGRQEGPVDIARGAMRMVIEAAEYFSDRTSHLSGNVNEGLKAAETLGAVSRQIRTLSSNTSLEASRLGGNATVAEIARQMRLLSQQVTALGEHLSAGLRAQEIALGEMSGAIDAVLADATSTQAILERSLESRHDDEPILPSRSPGLPNSAPREVSVNG